MNYGKQNWIIKNSHGLGWENSGYGEIPFEGHDYSDIKDRAYYVESIGAWY